MLCRLMAFVSGLAVGGARAEGAGIGFVWRIK